MLACSVMDSVGLFVDPLVVSGHRAQVEPLLRGAATQRHQPVGGRRDARNREPATVAERTAQRIDEGHRIVGETEDLGLEHRDVDEAGRTAIVPAAAYAPASHSPICPATNSGARSCAPRPRPITPPDHACAVNSVAGLSAHGPSRPNGVIAVTVRCGIARRPARRARSSSTRSIADPRDHTTASASPAGRATGSRRRRARDRRPRCASRPRGS